MSVNALPKELPEYFQATTLDGVNKSPRFVYSAPIFDFRGLIPGGREDMPKRLIPNTAKIQKTIKKVKDDPSVAKKIKDVVKSLGFAKTETSPELDAAVEKLRNRQK